LDISLEKMKVVTVPMKRRTKKYFSMGKVVPFRTHCPFTSLPLSYSPVSLRRDLLNPLQRQQYMKFCMFTHLLHRLATSGSIPKDVVDPLDDIQLDSALYELNKYRAYEKAVEQKKEERNDESQRVESQESEEEREYSEESSRTESSIRKMTTTGGRKRTRNVEDD
jgi:hypothetical protein